MCRLLPFSLSKYTFRHTTTHWMRADGLFFSLPFLWLLIFSMWCVVAPSSILCLSLLQRWKKIIINRSYTINKFAHEILNVSEVWRSLTERRTCCGIPSTPSHPEEGTMPVQMRHERWVHPKIFSFHWFLWLCLCDVHSPIPSNLWK